MDYSKAREFLISGKYETRTVVNGLLALTIIDQAQDGNKFAQDLIRESIRLYFKNYPGEYDPAFEDFFTGTERRNLAFKIKEVAA